MLIGLSGNKGVGKDTVGKILVDQHGFERIAFADKLKEAASALFDIEPHLWDVYKNDQHSTVQVHLNGLPLRRSFTVRHFLQRMGTEMGREVFGENFWVDLALDLEPQRLAQSNIVVTDVRFDNELERIRDLGGHNIHIVRPGLHGSDLHISERSPKKDLIDGVLQNNQDVLTLVTKVQELLNSIRDAE